MALGRILRENREQQGYSPAQVAEATHMMVQIVEELEREDFQRIAAPIYGRGFVKLYAEFLGIDPAPLVKEFSEIFSGSRRPVIATRPVNPAPSSDTRGEGAGVRVQGEDLSSREADNPDNPVILSKKTAGSSSSSTVGRAVPGEPHVSTLDLPNSRTSPAGIINPNQPQSTPPNPDISSPASAASVAPSPASSPSAPPVARPPSPSRVSDELDDLFGPRPAPAPAPAPERREALSVERSALNVERSPRPPSPTTHHSPPTTHHSPLTTHPLRLCAAALKQTSASLRRWTSALKSALPARWRSGPVLAGAAAGLLVIAAIVILAARSSSSPSSSSSSSIRQSSRQSLEPPTTDHQPPPPLTIPTILPPPEPYID